MKKYVFDLECNGFLDVTTHIYMIVVKQIGTDKIITFSDDEPNQRPISEFAEWVASDEVDTLIGHNSIRFDNEVVRKILGINLDDHVRSIDTMIMSRINNFIRPMTKRRHTLKAWGEHIGLFKDDYQDGFDTYQPTMYPYCIQDVKVTEAIYERVISEATKLIATKDKYKLALKTEHELSAYSAQQVRDGWLFNFDGCQKLIDEIALKMEDIEVNVEPQLNDRVIMIDSELKKPIYKKDGTYTTVSARVMGEFLGHLVTPEDALKANPPMKPGDTFQRTQIVPGSLGNQDIVKDYLESIGWKPREYNWKKIGSQFVKMSPKFCTPSLEAIGNPHANMISEYYTLRSRKSVLEGFMNQSEGDGRIRGDVNDNGAQSFRQTHRILANLPSGKAKYGKEIRELFIVPEGKTIISADGAAYQIRILAHYLKDPTYTDIVLNGDPHALHAEKIGCDRDTSKGVFFATLFGAGGNKIGALLGTNMKDGADKRQKLINGVPGMAMLITKVQNFVKMNGYIPGIDGRKVYPESDYKALNYLIQSCEASLMKATIVMVGNRFKENNIEAKQLLFYHDECSWEIAPKDVELATKLIKESFIEAPKMYGVDFMEAGDVKTGDNYYAVH